jgi:hypothetical protein
MNIKNEQLKSLMIRDKQFLRELYEGHDPEKKKQILNFASDLKVYSRKVNFI